MRPGDFEDVLSAVEPSPRGREAAFVAFEDFESDAVGPRAADGPEEGAAAGLDGALLEDERVIDEAIADELNVERGLGVVADLNRVARRAGRECGRGGKNEGGDREGSGFGHR